MAWSLVLWMLASSQLLLGYKIVVVREPNAVNFTSDIEDGAAFETRNNAMDLTIREVLVSGPNEMKRIVCAELLTPTTVVIDFTSPQTSAKIRALTSELLVPLVTSDQSQLSHRSCDTPLTVTFEPAAHMIVNVIRDVVEHKVNDTLLHIALVYDEQFGVSHFRHRILQNVPSDHIHVKLGENEEAIGQQIVRLLDIGITNVFLMADAHRVADFLRKLTNMTLDRVPTIIIISKDTDISCNNCKNGEKKTSAIVVNPPIPKKNDDWNSYYQFMKENGRNMSYNSSEYRHNVKIDHIFAYDLSRAVVRALNASPNTSLFTKQTCSTNIDHIFAYDLSRAVVRALNASPNSSLFTHPHCSTNVSLPDTALDYKLAFIDYLKQNTNVESVFGNLRSDDSILAHDTTLHIRQQYFPPGPDCGTKNDQCPIGTWSKRTKIKLEAGRHSVVKKSPQTNYRVVVVRDDPPFVSRLDDGSYVGFCIDMMEKIKETLGFNYSIYNVNDSLYGNINDNGDWNGLVKELIDKNADIALGPISVMAERENVIDFTVPFYDLVGISILMKKPAAKDSLFNFVFVLHPDVWWSSIASFFIVSFILFVFDRFSPFSYQNNKDSWKGDVAEPRVFTMKEGIWFCMMSLTPQGGGEAPRALSGRLIAATWWLFGFIMIAVYTANLAAFLTVSRLETTIESIDDLNKQFKTKYAPMEGSSAKVYFERMSAIEKRFYSIWKEMSLNDSLNEVERAKLAVWDYPVSNKFSAMWDTMTRSGFPANITHAKHRVLTESFAFIGDSTQVKYATLTDKDCSLMQVGEDFSRKPYAIAVQQGSPLKDDISNVILKLLQSRYLEELKDKWWTMNETNCTGTKDDEEEGISIRSIGGVFLLIAIGTALGLISLATEFYIYKYRPRRLSKANNVPNSLPCDQSSNVYENDRGQTHEANHNISSISPVVNGKAKQRST